MKDKCRWGKPRRYRHDSLLSCRNFRSGRSLPFQAVPNAPKISAVQEHCPPENHSPIAIRHSLSFHHSLFATRHSPPFLARQETRPPKNYSPLSTRHSLRLQSRQNFLCVHRLFNFFVAHNFPVTEANDALAVPCDVRFMGNDDDGSSLSVQILEQSHDFLARSCVKVTRRFIAQDDQRVIG